MATIRISNIDEALKSRLRLRAASHGKSVEEEARDILCAALSTELRTTADLGQAIRDRFAPLGGVDLPETPHEPIRKQVDFAQDSTRCEGRLGTEAPGDGALQSADCSNDPEWLAAHEALVKSPQEKPETGLRLGKITEDDKYGAP